MRDEAAMPAPSQVRKPPTLWPWSDLITLCERYVRPRLPVNPRILELGCGYGPNVQYLQTIGTYSGVDGDEEAVSVARERFPDASFACGDFTRSLRFAGSFDAIIDRGSLTINTDDDIRRAMQLIRGQLTPGGVFVGATWFSDTHTEYRRGVAGPDEQTRTAIDWPPLAHLDLVHFTNPANIRDLCEALDLVHLEHRTTSNEMTDPPHVHAYYNFVGAFASTLGHR